RHSIYGLPRDSALPQSKPANPALSLQRWSDPVRRSRHISCVQSRLFHIALSVPIGTSSPIWPYTVTHPSPLIQRENPHRATLRHFRKFPRKIPIQRRLHAARIPAPTRVERHILL